MLRELYMENQTTLKDWIKKNNAKKLYSAYTEGNLLNHVFNSEFKNGDALLTEDGKIFIIIGDKLVGMASDKTAPEVVHLMPEKDVIQEMFNNLDNLEIRWQNQK